jgi:hypothetical protein
MNTDKNSLFTIETLTQRRRGRPQPKRFNRKEREERKGDRRILTADYTDGTDKRRIFNREIRGTHEKGRGWAMVRFGIYVSDSKSLDNKIPRVQYTDGSFVE